MRRIASILILFALTACSVCKCPPVERRDSVRVEYRERVVHDTATVEVTKEVEKIVTRDTVSHLENSWASSDAMVSRGLLHHSLESKPRYIRIPVEVMVHDTLIIERSAKVVEVEVEKELTWWQKTRIGAFWWLLWAVVLLLVWTFRKRIFKIW